ncbi:46 kDa FK506-binding nuclear protein-like [Anthonomus grandis grandis]|uniref:46 kDa FK506-binding nuclear protein-like n=1 Tax=Anthonomus grandis grandis TaxID=2921223 RepID=UPI002165501F|nr:46 kDa FK506-binding nuclear protein-like [Anthonomus grandis grandis]
MFWGLIMEPERRYTQVVKKGFHISMASLDINSSDLAPSQIMCGYEGRNYLLCTLRKPDIIQCPMDLEFAEGTEVSFVANGKAHIHLTGYVTEPDEGLGLADLEEQEEEEEVEEIKSKGKRKKLTSLNNDKAAKKAKLANGSADAEEEESDDPDFEEASDNEEEASDEEGEGEGIGEEEDDDDDEEDDENDSSDEEVEEEEQPVQKKSKQQQKQEKIEAAKKKNAEQPKKKQERVLKGGVTVEDVSEGNGPQAKAGQFVTVYYEGRLAKNNKMFDSTSKGPGFRFRLGGGEVIKAWDVGVVGMKVGGVRKIVCPPQTAYGAKGSPPAIPPNSTLVFTVTLKKIK